MKRANFENTPHQNESIYSPVQEHVAFASICNGCVVGSTAYLPPNTSPFILHFPLSIFTMKTFWAVRGTPVEFTHFSHTKSPETRD